MSVAHLDEACSCGSTLIIPGRPQDDGRGRIIGQSWICAHCGAVVRTEWTAEYEAEIEAKALAFGAKPETDCAANRARHDEMRGWMRKMREWEASDREIRAAIQRYRYTFGDMDILTPGWTYEVTKECFGECARMAEGA